MDFRRITITVAPTLVICGLLGFAFSQNKLPTAGAATPPTGVERAPDQDESEAVQPIDLKKLPDGVRAAILKLSAEKNIRDVSKETDEGVTVFEVEFESEGKTQLAEISEQGDVLDINTELKTSSLPEPVSKAIKNAFPNGAVREANSVQVFFYEVEVMSDGKPHQLRVTATGEVLGKVDGDPDDQPLPERHVQH